jgi:DNA-binding beta-propeller fold protein YncE
LTSRIFLTGLLATLPPKALLAQTSALRWVQTIPLPGVGGRIDHFGADAKSRRLFVSALGNHTLEVLDLATSRRVKSIGGLKEPQGVVYVPQTRSIFVADGAMG